MLPAFQNGPMAMSSCSIASLKLEPTCIAAKTPLCGTMPLLATATQPHTPQVKKIEEARCKSRAHTILQRVSESKAASLRDIKVWGQTFMCYRQSATACVGFSIFYVFITPLLLFRQTLSVLPRNEFGCLAPSANPGANFWKGCKLARSHGFLTQSGSSRNSEQIHCVLSAGDPYLLVSRTFILLTKFQNRR